MTEYFVALSCAWMPPDSRRTLYNGRPLLYVEQSLSDWIARAGIIPVAIPFPTPGCTDVPFDATTYMRRVDALVLQGGVDVSPHTYGEQPLHPNWAGDSDRDAYEIALVEAALALDKPILGVCRGHQLLNVALGGTLYQDILTQVDGALTHRNADIYERNFHNARLTPDSWLSRLFDGKQTVRINSVHHQAIKDLAPGLVVQARSTEDDIIEAARLDPELRDGRWVVGVQWHPEFQDLNDEALLDPMPLLDALKRAIDQRRG